MGAVPKRVTAVTQHMKTLDFAHKLDAGMSQVDSRAFREETLSHRVSRRFSKRETAELMGIDHKLLSHTARGDEDVFPAGERAGRELSYSPEEICLMRAIMGSKSHIKRDHIHWRKPGDPLTVVTFGAQKGGTAKSLSAAHFAQYLVLAFGLRVGVIDSDPQSTVSLYFAGADNNILSGEAATMVDFMGIEDPFDPAPKSRTSEELDAVWQDTPWPGVRLMAGGPSILSGDVALYLMGQKSKTRVYSILKSAIDQWDEAHPPKTLPSDLRREDGTFDMDAYQRALNETLDVIIIDQQPSITLMQMNGIVAASTLVVPMTVKGFDLSTLTTYAGTLTDFLQYIEDVEPDLEVGQQGHVVLPTIIQGENDRDMLQISDLRDTCGDIISGVWYDRSAAVANAAELYMSIYEYTPPDGRRVSARSFMRNANSVNDYLAQRALPHLPARGFAEEFMKERGVV